MPQCDLSTPASVAELYIHRLESARARLRLLSRREFAFSMVRLALFFLFTAQCLAYYQGVRFSSWLFAPPIVLFCLLLVLHGRFVRAIALARLAEAFYKNGLARLDHTWPGSGTRGARYLTDDHPCAADLDLFGKGSLFELLCVAGSRVGQDTLAAWLLAPAAIPEIHARQQAVRELAPRLEDREEIFKSLRHTPRVLDTSALEQWAAAPPVHFHLAERLGAFAFSAVSLAAFAGGAAGAWNFSVFFLSVLVQAAFMSLMRRRVTQAIRFCEQTGHGLLAYVQCFSYLESSRFESPRLQALQGRLLSEGRRASAEVRRLDRLVGLLNDGQHNLAFVLPARLLAWTFHFAAAIEQWRRLNGPHIIDWLRAVGEVEALCSFAAFSFENPDHPFPELLSGPPLLDAESLGHPLLPAAHCVRNGFKLGDGLRILVVSGSNMSGKSTFLRTVGISVVLALAGAPVRAARMRLSPLSLYALIHKTDSLQDGFSRFYREIMRVRELAGMALRQPPLLFLIDEIFDGTNSHDRTVAAEAVVRTLAGRGAIGLVTSHDLALTEIAHRLAPAADNVHFEDQIEGDRLVFDYRLRPGAVQRGNALLLMRSIGLDV